MMGSEVHRVCACACVCMYANASKSERQDRSREWERTGNSWEECWVGDRQVHVLLPYLFGLLLSSPHSHTIIRDFETDTLTTLPFPDAAHGLEHTSPDAQVRDHSCLCSQHFVIVPRVSLSLGLGALYMYDAPTSVSYTCFVGGWELCGES